MKLSDVEKEALKVITACEKLRQKYLADGVKVYFKDNDNFTIKLISEEHVVRVIRIGRNRDFDSSKRSKNDVH